MKTEKRTLKYLTFYFIILHLIPFINIFYVRRFLRPFPIIDFVAIGTVFSFLMYISNNYLFKKRKSTNLERIIFLFVVWSFLSGLFYFLPGNPASPVAYFYGLHYCVLPIFIFYNAKNLKSDSQNSLLKRILYMNFFLLIVGLFFFFFRPEVYTEFLTRFYQNQDFVEWRFYSRLNSYLGSTTVGNVSVISLILINYVKSNPLFKAIFTATAILSILLTQQRGSIIGVVIVFIFFLVLGNLKILKELILIALFLIISVFLFQKTFTDILNHKIAKNTYNRVMYTINPTEMMEERGVGYKKGYNFLVSFFPLGLGVGATLSTTDSSGLHKDGQVVDANFMRIISDLGIIGFFLFVGLILKAIFAGFRQKKNKILSVIVIIYSLQAIGTNVFDSYYIIQIFWLVLAIIDTENKDLKIEKINVDAHQHG